MLTQSILIGLIASMCGGVFLELYVWVFRNPIVEGLLVGIILGDPMKGALIGATIQLIYMARLQLAAFLHLINVMQVLSQQQLQCFLINLQK